MISGIFAMTSRKRRGKHTKWGEIYHASYVLVFVSAIVLSIMNWEESAYLFYIALVSYALALMGYVAAKVRWKNWLNTHIGGMLGSYIGIVTATIVVNIPRVPVLSELPILIFWLLPTIIGTPLIVKAGQKYKPN